MLSSRTVSLTELALLSVELALLERVGPAKMRRSSVKYRKKAVRFTQLQLGHTVLPYNWIAPSPVQSSPQRISPTRF